MKCKHCNSDFISEKSGKLYCSIKCRKDYNKSKIYEYINICPSCNKETTHTRTNVYGSLKNKLGHSKCKSCQSTGRIYKTKLDYNTYDFWTDTSRYFRKCPDCDYIIEYKKRYYAYTACINNSKCMSCSSYGLDNGKIVETLRRYSVNSIDEYEKLLPIKTLYYKHVWQVTNKQSLTILENHEKRRGGGYALDHIYPISAGFRNSIPAELIGDIKNLQMLTKLLNEIKNDTIINIPKHIQNYLDK